MQISPIQQNNTNFKARLQLSGNTKLLNSENVKCLKNTVENIGTKSDIITIKLPETLKEDAFIGFAGFVDGVNVQISEIFDKNDGLMTALTKGLISLKKRVEEFLILKSKLDEYGIMPVEKLEGTPIEYSNNGFKDIIDNIPRKFVDKESDIYN